MSYTDYDKRRIGMGILVGSILAVLLNVSVGRIRFIGWIIAGSVPGFSAGMISKAGSKYGGVAGLASGITGSVGLLVLISILDVEVSMFILLFAIFLGLLGGAIGGDLREEKKAAVTEEGEESKDASAPRPGDQKPSDEIAGANYRLDSKKDDRR